jgi:hypothetical protein
MGSLPEATCHNHKQSQNEGVYDLVKHDLDVSDKPGNVYDGVSIMGANDNMIRRII